MNHGSENPDVSAGPLAMSVMRCASIENARDHTEHPCHQIVASQHATRDAWQLPEPWAGALSTARVLFVSSNPSVSEADVGHDEELEHYPTESWSEQDLKDFALHRFDGRWATADGRYRQRNGELSGQTVRFWAAIRHRAAELLGDDVDPRRDYAMTEVVHCKSRAEVGVSAASAHCVDTHLDRILRTCPAPVVVVIGSKARDTLREPWALPTTFGRGDRPGEEDRHLVERVLGGHRRTVVHLSHPTGMQPNRSFTESYPSHLSLLCGRARTTIVSATPAPSDDQHQSTSPKEALVPSEVPPTNIRAADDVLVVAAGTAWPFYRIAHAYVCQAGRPFRPTDRIAFYSQRTIHGVAALILHDWDDVELSQASAARLSMSLDPLQRRLGNVIAAALAGAWVEGERSKILLLSGPSDEDSVRFDPVTHHGPSAWTQRQRYASLSRLVTTGSTDDLRIEDAS